MIPQAAPVDKVHPEAVTMATKAAVMAGLPVSHLRVDHRAAALQVVLALQGVETLLQEMIYHSPTRLTAGYHYFRTPRPPRTAPLHHHHPRPEPEDPLHLPQPKTSSISSLRRYRGEEPIFPQQEIVMPNGLTSSEPSKHRLELMHSVAIT